MSNKKGKIFLVSFIAGAITGTVASYFSKKENREQIVTKYSNSKQSLSEATDNLKQNITNKTKEKVDSITNTLKNKKQEDTDKINSTKN